MSTYNTIQLRFTEVEFQGKKWYDSQLLKVSSSLGIHLEMPDCESHYFVVHQSLTGQKFTTTFHDYFGTLLARILPIVGVGQIVKIRLNCRPSYGIITGDVVDAGDSSVDPEDLTNGFASQDEEYFRSGNSEIYCFGT